MRAPLCDNATMAGRGHWTHPAWRSAPLLLTALWVLAAACSPRGDETTPAGSTEPTAAPQETAAAPQAATFTSGDLELAGDLYLPEGSGPFSGVVLIHGSGPIDRDATLRGQLNMTFPEPVTPFADLGRALRDAGYAVLTYDKRTCGPFNNCADNGYPQPPDDLTIDAFIADASAAVAHLRSLEQVDAARITVVGHSQGGSLVPGMLIDDPDLAAGVMLAAPHDPLEQVLIEQDTAYEDVARLRSEDVAGDTMIQDASADFWRSWLRVTDGVPQLASQVAQPLLVVGGEFDANVPPAQLEAWQRTLNDDEHAQVVELECVTHVLNCLATDDLSTVTPADVGETVAPIVTTTLVEFLGASVR